MRLKPIIKKSLLFAGCLYCISMAQAESDTEQQIKARYIYNFAKLITWPNPPQNALTVCLMGENSFQTQLEQLMREHATEYRRINGINEVDPCNILVLAPENAKQLDLWINQLNNKPILTISDSTNSLRTGIMIELVTHSDKIAFKINRKKASDSSLQMSAGLLKLAEEVL